MEIEQTLGLIQGQLEGVNKRLDESRVERKEQDKKVDKALDEVRDLILSHEELEKRVASLEPTVNELKTRKVQVVAGLAVLGTMGAFLLYGPKQFFDFIIKKLGAG